MEFENMIALTNPLGEDFIFKWDKVPHIIKAGETREFYGFLAKHGAKHLVDHIILHPECHQKLGIQRTTNDLFQGRDEIYEIILGKEKKIKKQSKKTEGEVVKEKMDNIKNVEVEKEEEFEDIKKLK